MEKFYLSTKKARIRKCPKRGKQKPKECFRILLLPLPPLDGSGAVQLLMGRESGLKFMEFANQPALGFIGIILAWNLFDYIFDPIHLLSINLLYPGLSYH
jgi:hypothetical protein